MPCLRTCWWWTWKWNANGLPLRLPRSCSRYLCAAHSPALNMKSASGIPIMSPMVTPRRRRGKREFALAVRNHVRWAAVAYSRRALPREAHSCENAQMPLEPDPGAIIGGRYELVEKAGRGGMADVWRSHVRGDHGFRRVL